MSANSDEPEKRSCYAGVHTNPTIHQPVTSTSIHGRNTAGNHEGYSSSISEQSISGQNRNVFVGNTLLGIGRGRPSHRDDKINYIQTDDGAKGYTTGSFKTSQRGSDSSSDTDTWVPPDCSDTATSSSSQQEKLDGSVMSKGQNASVTEQEKLDRSVFSNDGPDVKPDQGAIPKVKPAGGVFPKAWKDFHVSIKRKADMKILEQCSCKESDLPPVKMQYLLNFHFNELETALRDEFFKLKWDVKSVKLGDQCLSIEVKNYTNESVLGDVIFLLSDEVHKVNYFHSVQASTHPELLLKEFIDRGNLAIYLDGEKVFVVGIVENPRKVTEMLRKKPTSTDSSSTATYKTDVQLENPFKCQLLIYLQFLPTLKQKHRSVNVTLNEERSIMSVFGDNEDDVQAAVEDVHLFTKDFSVINTELDPLLIQLLKFPEIKTFIKQLCEEQDLKVIWTLSELNNSITCHGKDREAVQDFSDVLKHNLEKKTYRYSKQSFGDKTMIFSTTNMFSDFVKKYDGKCLVSSVQGNSIDIFTTRDISTELTLLEVTLNGTKMDIQKNLTQDEKKDIHCQKSATRKDDTTEEEMEIETSLVKVPMPHQELQMKKFEKWTPTLPITQRLGVSKDFVNCYSKLKSDVWKTFVDFYKVRVETDQNNEVVIVGSEKQKVQEAVSQLQKEIGKLTKEKWSCEVFGPRDIQAKLQSDIPSLENRFQCSVSIESNTSRVYQQQLGQWVNWNKGLHLILVHGHMSEMAADVLVCSINKNSNLSRPGSSMMEKGGSIMKQDLQQKAIVEGIYLSSETGNLPCLMVAYLAVPDYKHGLNMQSQVTKCIQELLCSVEKAQLQSLMIPVKLWDHIPETTFLQWFVSALNKTLGQMNALKQIYLCIEDLCKSDVKLKVLSDEVGTTWCKYDFEHLIENRQTSLPGKGPVRPAEINISLVKGKLVDQQVDVIVNSSNPRLKLHKGAVSASILEKGGISILDECKQRFPHGIDFGEIVCTKAGKMKFKFICHSALPYWTPSAKCSIKILEKLVFDCLGHAQSANCRSIAFPVFGTGVLEYPWDEVAKTMIETINKYGRMHYDTTIREVKIVLYDKDIKSIQAFETKKQQTEEVKLMPEDPETPPTFILESRCRNVRVQVIPLSDTNCHHCEAVVKFVTLGQALKLQEDNPQSNLATDGIVKSKNENSTFWTVTVISDDNEKGYKETVRKILEFATTERIATLAFCLMQSTGTPLKLKVQVTIIRDYIYTALQKTRYLQIVKIIVPSRDEFDLMLKDHHVEEPKSFFGINVFSSNTPPLKCVRYSDFVEKPRLLISVLGEKKRQIDELKENLQSTIQKLVKKNRNFMNVTIRHDSEKGKQDTSTKKWVRVLKQKDRMQMFQLSVEVCKQLDDAVKHNHPNVEVMEGVDVFVYKLDDFSYYVNENDDPAGIFYVEGSSNDPQSRNEGEKRMNQTYRQDSQDSKDVFDVVRGKINPSLKLENEVRAECNKQNIKYDGDTIEVEGTLKQLTSLNQYLITRFGEKMGLLNFEQKQETLPRKTHQAPHPNQQPDDIERKSKIKLTDMEYKMLNFYCPESQVFKRKCKYENDMLIIYPGTNETEEEFQLTIQSKLTHFNSMASFEVVPQDTMIDDDQLRKIEQEIPPNIFCYLSKDRKTLTLKGSNYEKLSVAKNKSEFILGLQKKTNNARRNRVISTDPNYESRKDKTPENRSFHQSINYSRSSSEGFSGSSRTYNSPAVKDLSYLTPEGLVVKVYVGSILHLNVDCIVNAANENLMHGGGVADVISRAAGYDFQKESEDYIQNNGPLHVTECCTTSPGNLKQYQFVIHAIGPKWYDYPYDKRACADDLQKTIVNCFKEAEVQNLSSVALPAISSGIFGVPKEVCCSQYCKAVIEYSNTCGKTTCLKEIHFMDKEPGMIQMIQAEFSQHLNMTQSASASGNTGPNPSTSTTNTWSRNGKGRLSRSFSDDPDKKHHHDNPSSGNPSSGNAESNTGQIAGDKFQKQYIADKDLRINIVQEDITKMTVDIIVCPQDDFCHSKGGIAQAISIVSNEWYGSAVLGMKKVNKCGIKKIKASPSSLPFKEVLHTVAPRWDKHAVKDNKTFEKELKFTIRNIVQHCSDSGTVKSVAIPVLGIGADGYQTPYVTYSSTLANEISKAMKSDKFSLTEIYIVTYDWSMASAIADHFDTVDSFKKVTSFKGRNQKKDKKVEQAADKEQSKDDFQASGNRGDVKLGTTVRHGGLENCVICMDKLTAPRKLRCGHIFCEECIGQQFKVKPVCPTCGSIQGIVTGDQPPGKIFVFRSRTPLPGYPQCGKIHIEYTIYDGQQGAEHPNPGRSFEGIKRTAYLPDNTRGQLIAKLLRVAFERRLVFTIGHSRTTGKQGVVTWNDIHHKTNPQSGSQFGYPDPTYFDRVIDELAAKGVTEKDLYT